MRVRHAELLVRRQRHELGERRVAAEAAAERAAREDQRRIEGERAEEVVDVVGDAERGAARVRVERRDQPIGRGRRPRRVRDSVRKRGTYAVLACVVGRSDLAQDLGECLEIARAQRSAGSPGAS